MAETDRELLELAAKAAGYEDDGPAKDSVAWECGDARLIVTDEGGHHIWNPLTDDGDALRLAVQIGPLEFSISEYGTAVRKPKGQWFGCEANLHGGMQAATRRAITRAAAQLARAADAGGKESS